MCVYVIHAKGVVTCSVCQMALCVKTVTICSYFQIQETVECLAQGFIFRLLQIHLLIFKRPSIRDMSLKVRVSRYIHTFISRGPKSLTDGVNR